MHEKQRKPNYTAIQLGQNNSLSGGRYFNTKIDHELHAYACVTQGFFHTFAGYTPEHCNHNVVYVVM